MFETIQTFIGRCRPVLAGRFWLKKAGRCTSLHGWTNVIIEGSLAKSAASLASGYLSLRDIYLAASRHRYRMLYQESGRDGYCRSCMGTVNPFQSASWQTEGAASFQIHCSDCRAAMDCRGVGDYGDRLGRGLGDADLVFPIRAVHSPRGRPEIRRQGRAERGDLVSEKRPLRRAARLYRAAGIYQFADRTRLCRR